MAGIFEKLGLCDVDCSFITWYSYMARYPAKLDSFVSCVEVK